MKKQGFFVTGSQKVIGSIPIFSTENQRVTWKCDSFFISCAQKRHKI